MVARPCSRSTCTCWPGRRWDGSARRSDAGFVAKENARSIRAFFRCSFDSPPAPPRPRRRTGHDIDAFAYRPQVDHVGGDPREAIVVLADPAAFIAVDAAGEGHFAILLEQRRV